MLLHKSLLAALIIAVVTAFAAPVDAQAQVTDPVEEPRAADEQTVGDLITALNNLEAEVQNLEMHQDLSAEDIHVVNVDELMQETDIEATDEALEESIEQHQEAIDDMRQRLVEHQVLQSALMQQDVNVEDVIAIEVKDDSNEVLVYHQPQVQEFGPGEEQDDY